MKDGARIVFVVAAGENGVIGRDGGLPWRLPSDLRQFRRLTWAKPVIMGRKTYLSIGKPLDGRDNIVLTRQANFTAPGVHVAATPEAALALARRLAGERGVDEVAVIGGAEVYQALLSWADRIYLTRVHAAPEGEATFAVDPAQWVETARTPMVRTERDEHAADFIVLDRKH